MAPEVILPFIIIAAIADYFQTVTGFGLGMIMMGATNLLNVAPISSIAAVVRVRLLGPEVASSRRSIHGDTLPLSRS